MEFNTENIFSELSLSRTKHEEFPFEFRKRIKFPFLSHFEKGNNALKKESFLDFAETIISHTLTHCSEFLSLLLYDIFVWFLYYIFCFGLNWSHNCDCVFRYAKRLSSSQQALFLLLHFQPDKLRFLLLLGFNNLF